jgi:hypothetical protein
MKPMPASIVVNGIELNLSNTTQEMICVLTNFRNLAKANDDELWGYYEVFTEQTGDNNE